MRFTLVIIVFLVGLGALIMLYESCSVGNTVSNHETIIWGGACYRDGVTSTTVCSSSCGGTKRVQTRATGETGRSSGQETCNSGYDCKYDGYSGTTCGGG